MRPNRLSICVFSILLWLGNSASAQVMNLSQHSSDRASRNLSGILLIGEIITRIANKHNYRALKSYEVIPDEWNADDRRHFLVDHAYYTLYSRDPKSILDLGPMHRGVSNKKIASTILVFKTAELAATEVNRLKERYLDNIGAKVIRSDSNGLHVKASLSSYIAVCHGASVILLHTDYQEETMEAIAAKLERAKW